MAGHEDQAEYVVLDEVRIRGGVGVLAHLEVVPELGDLLGEPLVAAEQVDRAALRHRHQPRARVVRYAGLRPLLQCRDERVLRELLREADVAGHAGQARDEPGRLHPPDGVHRPVDLGRRHVAETTAARPGHGRRHPDRRSGPPRGRAAPAAVSTSVPSRRPRWIRPFRCAAAENVSYCWYDRTQCDKSRAEPAVVGLPRDRRRLDHRQLAGARLQQQQRRRDRHPRRPGHPGRRAHRVPDGDLRAGLEVAARDPRRALRHHRHLLPHQPGHARSSGSRRSSAGTCCSRARPTSCSRSSPSGRTRRGGSA